MFLNEVANSPDRFNRGLFISDAVIRHALGFTEEPSMSYLVYTGMYQPTAVARRGH